jgi:hypothetical protein
MFDQQGFEPFSDCSKRHDVDQVAKRKHGLLTSIQKTQSDVFTRSVQFSAGHVREICWSNPIQMTGQAECKWVGKSEHLPIEGRRGQTDLKCP